MATEYGGDESQKNTVQGLGPNKARKLSSSEKLRLSRLTGQDIDPSGKRKAGFMHGIDPDFPEVASWPSETRPKAGP